MAAAAVGTTVGLYIVITQDTNHGAEHHPLGDPHGEGGAEKHGTDSSVGDENKPDEPEEESTDDSKDDSEDESKEPTDDHQDPNKATKQNSEEKDHQSPDQSDKVSVLVHVSRFLMLTYA
jgi:hypothetical protein